MLLLGSMETLTFHKDLQVQELTLANIQLLFPRIKISMSSPPPAVFEVFQALYEKPQKKSTLQEIWQSWSQKLSSFENLLNLLHKNGLLIYSYQAEEKPFFSYLFHKSQELQEPQEPFPKTLLLSQFAYLHRKEDQLLLESPLSHAFFSIQSKEIAALLFSLNAPKTIEELSQEFPEIPQKILLVFLEKLHEMHFLNREKLALETWEFHDLLFHSRSRQGRHGNPSGGTFPFLGKKPPLPALKNIPSQSKIALSIPKEAPDLSFFQVLDQRKSTREQGKKPITFDELSAFLYFSSRVKELGNTPNYDTTKRPYPGGGACYELEIYPLIYQCEGIEQGLYWYHPYEHALYKVSEFTDDVRKLSQDATRATGKQELSQISLHISARFARISWKYRSISYAVILKDAGVLISTMYLVASALHLAFSGVGGGNADLFTKVAKTCYFEESSVAEAILGSFPST